MVSTKSESKKINPPYFCFSLLLALYLILSLFAFEAVNIFQDGTEIYMNDVEFYLTNTMVIAFGVFLFFFAKRLFKTRINVVAFFFMLLLFVSNAYAIFALPDIIHTEGEMSYVVTSSFRLRSFYSFINVTLTLYILYGLVPQCKLTEGGMNYLLSFVSLVALSAVIASYFLDKDIYELMLKSDNFHFWSGPKSYCTEKNTFGALILFGICAEIYLFFFDKKWWRLPLLGYYFVSVFLTLSKTSIICAIFVFLVSISYGFIRLFFYSKKWWALLLFALYIGANIALVYLFFHNEVFSGSFFGKILAIIKDAIMEPDSSTMGAREIIWHKLLDLVKSDNQYLIFGFGDASFPFIFGFASDGNWKITFSAHNGFLDQLGRGGLIRLGVYVALLVYLFILCFRFISSKKSKGGALYLIFLLTFLLHSAVESEYLLGNDFKSLIWSFLTVVPLLSLKEDERHPKRKASLIKDYCSAPVEYPSSPFLAVFSTFALAVSLSLSPVFFFLLISGYLSSPLAAFISAATMLLAICFFIVRMRYFHNDKEKVALIVSSLLFILFSFSSAYLINMHFSGAPIPYTHACYAVSIFAVLISTYGIISVLDKDFALLKLTNRIERAYKRKNAIRLLKSR